MGFIVLGCPVTQHFEGGAAFQDRTTLQDQLFEFDGANFRAILIVLRGALALFILVELGLDTLGFAMKHIGEGPQQIRKIRLEARILEGFGQGLKQRCDGVVEGRGFGEAPRIWLIVMGMIAVELQLFEDTGGR
jgi:hypothetical protein